MPAVVICCALAFAAQAQTRNFPYPEVSSSPGVLPITYALGASDGGLQVSADPLAAQDKKFAARPSPYAQGASQTTSQVTNTSNAQPEPEDVPAPQQTHSHALATATNVPAEAKKTAVVVASDSDVPAPKLVHLSPKIAQDHVASAKAALQKPKTEVASAAAPKSETKIRPVVMASDSGIPAPVLVVQNVVEKPASVSLPSTQNAFNAAQVLAGSAVSRAGEQSRAVIAAQSELASLVVTQQLSVANLGSMVAAQAVSTQLALNDAKNLSALAPAAGPVPGGAIMPVQTLPAVVPVAVAPEVVLQPASASKPAEIMDLPPVANTPSMPPAFVPTQPAELSSQSKAIVSKLPPQKQKKGHTEAVKVEHFQKNPLENEEVRKHEGIGISISVRRPKPNISHMLEQAYDALIAGNQEEAITTYKDVLKEEPENKLALFGLATTYHRAGQLDLARPLYGKLLAIDPNNAEGLNNFLVLLGDEAPGEALTEMKKLQHTHPDFSPLPAQMAVIYEKMGEYDNAIASMKHAIILSPENIKYRYDMGVMMDKAGDWENAAVFYQQLITAADRGEKIPAREEEIQERLTFIRSNKPKL